MFLLVQKTKDRKAASRFFRKLVRGQERSPQMIVTDELPSYGVARRKVMPSSLHCNDRFANNRVEVSHEHTGAQERQMRRFKSHAQAQRCLSVHNRINNLFRIGMHLLSAENYRTLRNRSFKAWQQVTCV